MDRNDSIEKLYEAIMYVRTNINPDMQIQQLLVYLKTCIQEGVTMTQLGDELDMPSGSISRNLKTLSKYVVTEGGKKETCGFDLVLLQPDLEERRKLGAHLTSKGKRIMAELARIIQ